MLQTVKNSAIKFKLLNNDVRVKKNGFNIDNTTIEIK